MTADGFSAPFNWCDRRCERCPLEAECPVRLRDRQQRFVHEARGEDPDDLGVVMGDMAESFAKVLAELRGEAEQQGIDPDAPLPEVPVVLSAVRLKKAGIALAKAIAPLVSLDTGDRLDALAVTVAMKTARVAGYLEHEELGGLREGDAAANLMLLDRLRADLARAIERAGAIADDNTTASLKKALGELNSSLDPLLAAMGDGARRWLAALVERGVAPSPFCVVGHRDPAQG